MSNPFAAFCDDFYVNLRLVSQIPLPAERETVLHLFERVQKSFPDLARFRRADSGELNLESEAGAHSSRWIGLDGKRLASGHVNPESIEDALRLHRLMLQLAPHHLGVSPMEIDYLEILFGFDLAFGGNQDEVVADTLFRDSPVACLADEIGARPVDFQPTATVALSEDGRLQGRIDVVTRTAPPSGRQIESPDDVISVYLSVRQYWNGDRTRSLEDALGDLSDRAEGLCARHLVPRVLQPLSSAIASRS
jgi:hypothetical protein